MSKYEVVDISNEVVTPHTTPNKRDNHIEVLEDKVDSLELEVASLKKKLALKPKVNDYEQLYKKALEELHHYWYDELPF